MKLKLCGYGCFSLYVSIIFVIAYVVLVINLKEYTYEFAVKDANKELKLNLLYLKAQRNYIQDVQKNIIYDLQENNKLITKDYFNPAIMSSTFIVKRIYEYNTKLIEDEGMTPYIYKLAAQNPRNPLNKADVFETSILKKMQNGVIKEYEDIIEQDGVRYLFYATPLGTNEPECMRCHGDPNNAPKELVDMYGDTNGFHEKLGDIRAILTLKVPLEKELEEANTLFYLYSAITFLVFVAIYSLIFFIAKQQKKFYATEQALQNDLILQKDKLATMGEMMGSIAHQWKQPLHSVSMLSSLIEEAIEENTPEKEAEILRHNTKILESVRFMDETMNTFRGFLKPSSELTRFTVYKEILEIQELFRYEFMSKSILLEGEAEDDFALYGAPNEFKQIILNLFSNAKDALVENNAPEERNISYKITASASKGIITIEDNGGGIPEHLLPSKLFEKYNSTKGSAGTGLGLPICKLIIEEHFGGNISVSNTQKGALFTLEFPLKES